LNASPKPMPLRSFLAAFFLSLANSRSWRFLSKVPSCFINSAIWRSICSSMFWKAPR